MRSPDEIKKGLECCSISYADCNNECPYKRDCDGSQILKDAIALIRQLEAERDELIEAIKKWSPFGVFPLPCKVCKNVKEAFCGEKCKWCRENSNFEWRGLQKEEIP